jgi:potassium-dependent mechanosensitive channel
LVILFERPVRVGDVVTVGDISGTISRIRIRATTVTDFDRKELIVPNKSFITEKVVNWTLSDSITRITLNVRIAYGSDTALAHQVIVDVVKNHPLVLQEPVPNVYFVGFGENSLNFVVWAFVKELGNRFPLIHELNTNINRSLREQGIEIPLPQRDIFVRSSPSAPALAKFNPGQESGQAPLEAPLETPPPHESQQKSVNTRGSSS